MLLGVWGCGQAVAGLEVLEQPCPLPGTVTPAPQLSLGLGQGPGPDDIPTFPHLPVGWSDRAVTGLLPALSHPARRIFPPLS